MITGYTTIRNIISTVYRTTGINSEVNELDCVEWSFEALSMIGAYSQFAEITKCLDLVDGKAKLPCNFHKLVDIRYKSLAMYWATNTNANNYQCDGCQIPPCNSGECNYTFYINDGYLITNLNKNNIVDNTASVCIVYLGLPVDDEGFPLIPDDIYYSKAISSYIIERIDYQEWRKGKITDKVYDHSEKDWLFYVNSARGAANMPNTAQLENLQNILVRLMPLRREYSKGFVNTAKGERIDLK